MSIGIDIDIKFHCFSVILFGVVYVSVGVSWVCGCIDLIDKFKENKMKDVLGILYNNQLRIISYVHRSIKLSNNIIVLIRLVFSCGSCCCMLSYRFSPHHSRQRNNTNALGYIYVASKLHTSWPQN